MLSRLCFTIYPFQVVLVKAVKALPVRDIFQMVANNVQKQDVCIQK